MDKGYLTPSTAGDLKKGGHVMMKGLPCKIMDIATSKTGKHGHAKCNITGIDLLGGKKCNDVWPSHGNVYVPQVKKIEYQLLDINNGELHLLDSDNKEFNTKLDGDAAASLQEAWDADQDSTYLVTILFAPKMDGDNVDSVVMYESVAAFKKEAN